MAGKRDENAGASAPKKADLIIKMDQDISTQISQVSAQIRQTDAKLNAIMEKLAKGVGAATPAIPLTAAQMVQIFASIKDEYESVKREIKFLSAQNESIYDNLNERIENLSKRLDEQSSAQPAREAVPATLTADLDYDVLAKRIVELMPAQEYISPDYIACKVAEQIVIPESTVVVSEGAAQPVQQIAPVAMPVDVQLDEEELADRIALKVGSLKSEDFDILVDDDGCASISREIAEKLDYEVICSALAEKLRAALDIASNSETDYEEMAQHISDKITVAGINEDVIADKAAAALSNYLPEIDSDDIADKVAAQLLSTMPALDSETISTTVADKIIESQSARDYDIVVDEDGIDTITKSVSGEVLKSTDERFDDVEKDLKEIKLMLLGGAVVHVAEKAAESDDEEQEPSEELVTVSDIVDEESGEEEEDEVMDDIVDDIDEEPVEGEMMPDGADGVDFAHMMKYNRSFIARIIQGTDDQKQYYGQVKNALLSYAKVNSNVAWGAERFHKGRETIARFKIRGKTLCLYLALDPEEYPTSVYHHVDVSNNKSMHGTPMMVKIKSPLGARKAIRLIDEMLEIRGGVKRNVAPDRDYAAMYPYEDMDELIEDGLVKDVSKNK